MIKVFKKTETTRDSIAKRKEVYILANAELLGEKIKISGLKKGYLADKCDMTRQCFQKRAKNPALFTAAQVSILCRELRITNQSDVKRIFFT